jgi:hypothetical protein
VHEHGRRRGSGQKRARACGTRGNGEVERGSVNLKIVRAAVAQAHAGGRTCKWPVLLKSCALKQGHESGGQRAMRGGGAETGGRESRSTGQWCARASVRAC